MPIQREISPTKPPIIGISGYAEPAQWNVWHTKAALLPYAYVQSVTAVGGYAVILPPERFSSHSVSRLDGLILAGGADLSPDLYGQTPHERTYTRPDRDRSELALAEAALDIDLPILGICRGMQLLAVAYGGRLKQHLPDELGSDEHQPAPGVFGQHAVHFRPETKAASIFGDTAEVNSYHHQGVEDPGSLTITGWAPDDVIEVLEDPDKEFVLGVQWHPEELGDPRLFSAFVDVCSRRAERVEDLMTTH
ncbi:MAG: gamma-glutamyl-gamma-aminobutyrate hydrolase family protein [Corynebacteriales bacterium]|nr:gamma-glutamyl-gamma-aminobutyrate hydrolase family protein [Mycobacteriales bacterium]